MSSAASVSDIDLLSCVGLLSGLDRMTLARLTGFLDRLVLEDGAVVFRQGDPPDGLYLVTRGTFGVFLVHAQDGTEYRVGLLTAGDDFGELGLLTDEPRGATVRAIGGGEVLRLDRVRFQRLVQDNARVATQLAITLGRRLRAVDEVVVNSERALERHVDAALERLAPDTRAQVLRLGVLEAMASNPLHIVVGPDGRTAERELADAGLSAGEPAALVIPLLRKRLEREVGPAGVHAAASDLVAHLAESGQWDAALAVSAEHASRSAFTQLVARAARGIPALPARRLVDWVGRLSDDEAVTDPELARLRAAWYEAHGDHAAAARVERRAMAAALVSPGPSRAHRLAADLLHPSGLAGGLGALVEHARTPSPRVQPGSLIAAPLAVVLGAAAVLVPTPEVRFLLLLGAAIALWVSQLLPDAIVSLGLVASWVVFGLAAPGLAAVGFASVDWMFVVAVLGLSAAISRSGLIFRAGLLLVPRMPRTVVGQSIALLVTGVVLSALLPSALGRLALTMPLALAIADALRLQERGPGTGMLSMAAWIGSGGPLMFMFMNATPFCLLLWGLMPEQSRLHFDWLQWAVAAAPLGLLVSAGMLVFLRFALHPGAGAAPPRERVQLQLAVLGPPSRRELSMLVILILTVIGWLLAPTWGVHMAVIAILGLVGAVVSGNFDRRALQDVDLNFLIFYGVTLSIARLWVDLGVDRLATGVVSQAITHVQLWPMAVVCGLGVLHVVLRFALPQPQAILVLGLALIPAAATLGVDAWIVAVTLLATSSPWFFPSQTITFPFALSASEGRLFSAGQARRASLGYVVVTLIGLAVCVPYWHALGLL